MIVGVCFVGIGVFVVVPQAGFFGIIWTLGAFLVTGYHAANIFSSHGVAHEVVDFDTSLPTQTGSSATAPPEQRLATLNGLKRQGLVN